MKAVQTFTVLSELPPQLEPLHRIAMNLGWSDDERARDLFSRLQPHLWDLDGRDPATAMATETADVLQRLAEDGPFTSLARAVLEELERSAAAPRWFQERAPGPLRSIAYFSPEFGIAAGLPQYSGGLGVLAGDHLRAANDLGLPLVGVGLFYRHGYFRQVLDADGWQVERFPRLDPRAMALALVPDLRIQVDLAGVEVHAQLWRAEVGRIRLYLIDTDVEENDERHRLTCDRLYGGGREERIRQEIVLGVGGVRALEALGERPQLFHMNEGHAGFSALERIRRLMLDDGLTFAEARTALRPGTIFTTHTPVPAGIDRFGRDLVEKYFSGWCAELGLRVDDLMAIGAAPVDGDEPPEEVEEPPAELNMAAMGLRLSGRANGVARLHGAVSRSMFRGLWPQIPPAEVPITSVTNGVHGRTWASGRFARLYERELGVDWSEAAPEEWRRLDDVGDREIWKLRNANREVLVGYARRRLRQAELRRGTSESLVAWTDAALDPDALTIGFARRFATYKRAALVLSDLDRLSALLLDPRRPVQIIFAGKAHPADEPGHRLVQEVANLASDPELRSRLVFLEDYDIGVARMLVQGADVWLNTPLRPNEACGTSGMKVVFNGGLNCSILDGWWDEMYEPDLGWAIPSAERQHDPAARNAEEAAALYSLLEREVVPEFYRRDDDATPTDWIRRMKRSITKLAPKVESSRMLKQYVTELYEPAAREADHLSADGFASARALTAWKRSIEQAWPEVQVLATRSATTQGLPAEVVVEAEVALAGLDTGDVRVEVLYGAIDLDEELRQPTSAEMAPKGSSDGQATTFTATLLPGRPGSFGFTVRVMPAHADLPDPAVLGRVAWAADPADDQA